MIGWLSALMSARHARRWLAIGSVPLVVLIAAVTLALHAKSPAPVATSPACGGAASATASSCVSPSPTVTDTPVVTDTPSAAATPTDTATSTPAPTPSPTPFPYALTGESAVLAPCDLPANAQFGGAVAVSGDGTQLVVGAANANGGSGVAYVFARGIGGWIQTARLTAGSSSSAAFGTAVAMSDDGSTALVSAPGVGATYVFSRTPTNWVQTAQLVAPDRTGSASDLFGAAVSLSADGRTAAVSRIGYLYHGTAFVYTRTATWSLAATLTAAVPAVNDGFGTRVALAAGGTRLVLSDPESSSADVYDGGGGTWSLSATLPIPHPGAPGVQVAISADGNTVLAADFGFYAATSSAFGFKDLGGTWTAASPLPNPGSANGGFGQAMSVSADGSRAVVGDDGTLMPAGTAYLFGFSGGSWSAQRHLVSPLPSANDRYGLAVAVNGDASIAAVGASAMGSGGAVVIFSATATGSLPQTLPCG